ncbi:MAG: hypothetical protein BJ554DRAFT_5065, partial [Olpidium bornovanus]
PSSSSSGCVWSSAPAVRRAVSELRGRGEQGKDDQVFARPGTFFWLFWLDTTLVRVFFVSPALFFPLFRRGGVARADQAPRRPAQPVPGGVAAEGRPRAGDLPEGRDQHLRPGRAAAARHPGEGALRRVGAARAGGSAAAAGERGGGADR